MSLCAASTAGMTGSVFGRMTPVRESRVAVGYENDETAQFPE